MPLFLSRILAGASAVALLSLQACSAPSGAAPESSAQAKACDVLTATAIPDVKVTEAVEATDPVAHCKVTGTIGSKINFAVWLPRDWNGKFVMGGQGGFAGNVESQAIGMMDALRKGYATAGTDTGHKGTVAGGEWALGDMEAIVNYGHLASHRTSETSKALVAAHYGRTPERSYFAGCSNGGRQALMAAQHYPDDFDGIIVGAPVVDFVGVALIDAFVTSKMYPDPKNLSTPVLNKADREALGAAVLASCDMQDGLKDGIVNDPRSCKFDAATLACKSGNSDGCLNGPELAAVRAIVEGPRSSFAMDHVVFPFGGESFDAGWGRWMAGQKDGVAPGVPSLFYGFGAGFIRYLLLHDANWDYTKIDVPAVAKAGGLVQATVSPTSTDLSPFRKSGGKMLIYHGWLDSALSPLMTIDHVEKIYAADATAAEDVKLFMLPGVHHCAGGPGPHQIAYLDVLDKWIASGEAPAEIEGSSTEGRTRKVCAHPKVATFNGKGDGSRAEHFDCN